MYSPDNWIILKIESEPGKFIYKVLAGWSGGYLNGDSWRINSGIKEVVKEGDFYLIKGYSGSVYRCHKESETVRMNTAHILTQIKDMHGDKISEVSIKEIL